MTDPYQPPPEPSLRDLFSLALMVLGFCALTVIAFTYGVRPGLAVLAVGTLIAGVTLGLDR